MLVVHELLIGGKVYLCSYPNERMSRNPGVVEYASDSSTIYIVINASRSNSTSSLKPTQVLKFSPH